jgi:ATP-dependent Zn protease
MGLGRSRWRPAVLGLALGAMGFLLAQMPADLLWDGGGSRGRRRRRKDDVEGRVAVHECGHLVALWACTNVSVIHEVSLRGLDEGASVGQVAGHVHSAMFDDDDFTMGGNWCRMVVFCAGAAAEGYVFDGTSGGHGLDIDKAILLARELVARGFKPPALEGPTLKLQIGKLETASTKENELVLAAFRQAWRLIEVAGDDFDKVVDLLIEKRTLKEADVQRVLGSRWPALVAGIFKATFLRRRLTLG